MKNDQQMHASGMVKGPQGEVAPGLSCGYAVDIEPAIAVNLNKVAESAFQLQSSLDNMSRNINTRYVTLENIAPLSDDPIARLPICG